MDYYREHVAKHRLKQTNDDTTPPPPPPPFLLPRFHPFFSLPVFWILGNVLEILYTCQIYIQ